MKKSKLTIVGAGPGDPELITLKGLKAIENADVILYDALVNPLLLDHAKAEIPKIFVGKRKGIHTFTQEQINDLIIENALKYGNIIRLKGGDPFVFGRGFEEIQHAGKFNISTEYIPGVSSSISVLGLQGIPVTHRGSSESFWVVTATTSNGKLSDDIKIAAQSTATIVILMGLTKLQEITEIFKSQGKQDAAIAIIQKGSLPDENIAIGTIASIMDIVREKHIAPPAIIVIGNVVKLQPKFPKN
jgi:uroporphyrin-III C-methyltransferase